MKRKEYLSFWKIYRNKSFDLRVISSYIVVGRETICDPKILALYYDSSKWLNLSPVLLLVWAVLLSGYTGMKCLFGYSLHFLSFLRLTASKDFHFRRKIVKENIVESFWALSGRKKMVFSKKKKVSTMVILICCRLIHDAARCCFFPRWKYFRDMF